MTTGEVDYQAISTFLRTEVGEGIHIAGMTGSFAAGLANSTSDLDLFLVLDDARYCADTPSYFQSFQNERWKLDALFVSHSEWVRVVTSIAKTTFGYLSENGRLIEKVMNSRVFIGQDNFESLVTMDQRAVFQQHLFEGHRSISLSIYEDYIGALSDMEPVQVTELLQEILRCELECVLIASGDCYRKPKWISKRLLRSDAVPRRFYDTYRKEVLCPPELGSASWHQWRKDMHRFHRELQYHLLFGETAVTTLPLSEILGSGQMPIGSSDDPKFLFSRAERYFFRGLGNPFEISSAIAWLACQFAGSETPNVIKVPVWAKMPEIRSAYLEMKNSRLLL